MAKPITAADLAGLPDDIKADVARQLGRDIDAAQPKPSKYRNKPTYIDGIRFDSGREAKYYEKLVMLRDDEGSVLWFARQCVFDLPGGVKYRADFIVADRNGSIHVVDVKGMRTPVYAMKRKQVKAIHGVEIEEA